LQKKVPLGKIEKDIDSINTNIKEIHAKGSGDITLTTIHLPTEIHTKIKMHCVANGISIKEYITQKLIESIKT
jgi:galactitol-specific phosphotransferase system IIB component